MCHNHDIPIEIRQPAAQDKTKPEPSCPDCGASPMKLPRPNPSDHWQAFWGCKFWPDCSGKRQIMPDGTPETDDDWLGEIDLSWP